jgi:hypothetical protein
MTEFVLDQGEGGDEPDEFKVWIAGPPNSPTHKGLVGVPIKRGPRVCKTVSLARSGDRTTDEVDTRVLQPWGYPRRADRWVRLPRFRAVLVHWLSMNGKQQRRVERDQWRRPDRLYLTAP